jgi:hypothetical protein
MQIRRDDAAPVMQVLRDAGLGACSHTIGRHQHGRRDPRLAQRQAGVQGQAQRPAAGLERSQLPDRPPARRPACARRNSMRCRCRPIPACRSTLTPADTSPRRSSRPVRGRRLRSCASRASTARWKWPPPSTAPASRPYDVHMSDLQAGVCIWLTFQGLCRLRRLLLRRRARRRPGLGQVDPVQRTPARRIRGLLRSAATALRWACATAAR